MERFWGQPMGQFPHLSEQPCLLYTFIALQAALPTPRRFYPTENWLSSWCLTSLIVREQVYLHLDINLSLTVPWFILFTLFLVAWSYAGQDQGNPRKHRECFRGGAVTEHWDICDLGQGKASGCRAGWTGLQGRHSGGLEVLHEQTSHRLMFLFNCRLNIEKYKSSHPPCFFVFEIFVFSKFLKPNPGSLSSAEILIVVRIETDFVVSICI